MHFLENVKFHELNITLGLSSRKPNIPSSNLLDFPSLTLSPMTALNNDEFDQSSSSLGNLSKVEKAIVDKGFYFHLLLMTSSRELEPQLLPLFPLSLLRVSLRLAL